jgi:hypothetical protein
VDLVPVPLLRNLGRREEDQVSVRALGQEELDVVVAEQADLPVARHASDEVVLEPEEDAVVDVLPRMPEEPDRGGVGRADERLRIGNDE